MGEGFRRRFLARSPLAGFVTLHRLLAIIRCRSGRATRIMSQTRSGIREPESSNHRARFVEPLRATTPPVITGCPHARARQPGACEARRRRISHAESGRRMHTCACGEQAKAQAFARRLRSASCRPGCRPCPGRGQRAPLRELERDPGSSARLREAQYLLKPARRVAPWSHGSSLATSKLGALARPGHDI